MSGDSVSRSLGSSLIHPVQSTKKGESIDAVGDKVSAISSKKKVLKFERLEGRGDPLLTPAIHRIFYRAKIPGGWLLVPDNSVQAPFFIPDPKHKWDGNSLP